MAGSAQKGPSWVLTSFKDGGASFPLLLVAPFPLLVPVGKIKKKGFRFLLGLGLLGFFSPLMLKWKFFNPFNPSSFQITLSALPLGITKKIIAPLHVDWVPLLQAFWG